MKNYKYCRRQYELAMLRAQQWMASINSGHYKQRGLQRGTDAPSVDGRIVFRDCTEEEKLAEAMATVQRHIEFAQQCSETLAEHESDEEYEMAD